MTGLPLGALGRESASITYNVIDFALLVFHCIGCASSRFTDIILLKFR